MTQTSEPNAADDPIDEAATAPGKSADEGADAIVRDHAAAESSSEASNAAPEIEVDPAPSATTVRKRPKPGERRVQILQTLATMLEQPGADRVTTAALAS